jgi:hypothetical protein
MKELKDYLYLVPLWIREDEAFNKFYSEVIQIFLDCQEAKDNLVNSFKLAEIENYDKSLEVIASYFGINRNFYLPSGNEVVDIYESAGEWTYDYLESVAININIPNQILLRLIKFKLLQSNFDGTIKNLIDKFKYLFKDSLHIQFIESSVSKEVSPGVFEVYPELNLNLVLNETISLEEATLFINGAYSFNYLGVKTTYSLGGKTIELIWDQSEWDRSNWI